MKLVSSVSILTFVLVLTGCSTFQPNPYLGGGNEFGPGGSHSSSDAYGSREPTRERGPIQVKSTSRPVGGGIPVSSGTPGKGCATPTPEQPKAGSAESGSKATAGDKSAGSTKDSGKKARSAGKTSKADSDG